MEIDIMKNLRFNVSGDTLEVTGQPRLVANVPAGHRLVLVDGGHYLTMSGSTLYGDGVAIASLAGSLVGIHRVGGLIVAVTTQGMTYLDGESYAVVTADAALPVITISSHSASAMSASLPAIAFAEPYSTWQAPLQQPDVNALTAGLRTAWNNVTRQAQAQGLYYGPVQVRYGVRLWDDSYLWVSEPVTLGMSLLTNAPDVNVDADVDGGKVTGVPAATLSLSTFTLDVEVSSGVAEQWRSMVKAVDVMVTGEVSPAMTTSSIFYRCLTTTVGTRRPVLNYGFTATTAAQALAQMSQSSWTVVASCTDLDALEQGRWLSVNVPDKISLTPAQCHSATLPGARRAVASIVCNGRLYVADAAGLMTTSRAGNPLVVERQCVVTGARLLGLSAVPRSLYSGGFGRYPVYMFTDEGIYAVPLTAQGAYGEPRLLDRAVLAAGCRPVEGDRDVYFTSTRGYLCRLRASTVTVLTSVSGVDSMAWDDFHRELWCVDATGHVTALASGVPVKRSVVAVHLYDDLSHALAVAASGEVRDLADETAAMMEVELLTAAEECRVPLRRIEWQVYGDDVHLRLDVLGERGMSCHGFIVNRMTVTGRVAAPIVVPVFAPPLRIMRRHITGSAATGTVIKLR